jgi:glycerol transport system ATP-binding protein
MTWENGKRYAILGPSGCGKTTMLNIVSGLIKPTQGRILFDDEDVTSEKTETRNISQVFQFPVIYNTMSVYDNLALTLNLSSFLNMPARKLTADQKQLISLGRGLVREDVAAVLMDEPLTVIDPDLKFRLRRNLKEINEEYKTTLVYVTHDQNEAMTFADNIIVMDQGEIVQVGLPKDLFERPKTTFVGYFIGSPAMNLFETQLHTDNSVKINDTTIKTNTNLSKLKNNNIKLGIRSEFVKVAKDESENLLEVNIQKIEDFGNFKLLTTRMGQLTIKSKINREIEIANDKVKLHFPPEKCCVYQNNKLI